MSVPIGERWQPIPGWPGYEASSLGRIASHLGKTPRIRRLQPHQRGYLQVVLRRDGKPHTKTVHNLVATAFHGPGPEGLEVRHLDGDKHNNAPGNLRWGTKVENQQDAMRHGTHVSLLRLRCGLGHLLRGADACPTCAEVRADLAALL